MWPLTKTPKNPPTLDDEILERIAAFEREILSANLKAIEAQMELEEYIAKKAYLETVLDNLARRRS